jgi:uncharacterized protein with HEPN domain
VLVWEIVERHVPILKRSVAAMMSDLRKE